jgi:adenylylsulfate reductase subunit A
MVGEYIDHTPTPTCLRNHAFIEEVKAGRGPIHMVTMEAFKIHISRLLDGKTF